MTQERVIAKKKLIEVALPLEAINKASAREKSIRHGHPSMLHLWWARRPLAAARAVIFAQMVDDPSANPDLFPTERAQERERQRLFGIIEELVLWENMTNEVVLQKAREEIWQSWRRACAENADHPRAKELFDRHLLPAFHDPFAGGGSLPLEAQRLGLDAYASDLNPVAVLINKAMIEIPPKFAGKPPMNPKARSEQRLMGQVWRGAYGLAEDVRHYGQWMRDEAQKRIGHLYPTIAVTAEMAADRPDLKPYVGQELTVIAWLWAHTVKSPNPAFAHVDVPLASTFILSTKPGHEAFVEPTVDGDRYEFSVRTGTPPNGDVASGTGAGKRGAFRCILSGSPITYDYIRNEGKHSRLGSRLMAVVAEGNRGRLYLPATAEHEAAALEETAQWRPTALLEGKARVNVSLYGFDSFGDLFTARQLAALATLADLVTEARTQVLRDAVAAGMEADGPSLHSGGSGAAAYADAISIYLAFAVDKVTDYNSSLVLWSPTRDQAKTTFSRQALQMAWDFAEINPLAGSAGDLSVSIEGITRTLAQLGLGTPGHVTTADAQSQRVSAEKVISTDPPYYDNISYADLSDFFYVWLRRSLRNVFPDELITLAVPKIDELVAAPYRHDDKRAAEDFFLGGMTRAMSQVSQLAHPAFPISVYYAFRQSESEGDDGTASTGWETFLGAVHKAGLSLTGTWPVRTERGTRAIGIGSNALASSIVLVCRRRAADAPSTTRREFQEALRTELPVALKHLQRGNIAPVDLAQASIGPGMGVFTRYREVLNADGSQMSVREALALINATLDEVLAEQEGDFDADSRWALTWFEQFGYAEGDHGDADILAKAKNTSTDGMEQAGILLDRRGKVRLFKPAELRNDWDPTADPRLTVWEMTHHLIRTLESGGESAAAALAAKLGSKAEIARELAYRLYTVSERKKRAADALAYNGLVQSWPEIVRLAREEGASEGGVSQGALALDQP